MRMRHAGLIITIAAVVTVVFDAASAKGSKTSSTLMEHTATGKHYNNVVLTPTKPKTPVAKKPATNSAADKTTKPVLKLDGIKGESMDDKHKQQIEIQ